MINTMLAVIVLFEKLGDAAERALDSSLCATYVMIMGVAIGIGLCAYAIAVNLLR